MAHRTRRILLPTALVLFFVLISVGRVASPDQANAVFDPNGPAFDALSAYDVSVTPVEVRQPPRLLAGTNSHRLPASAASRNGYCVDANINGVTPVPPAGPSLGFRLFATDPINPIAPALIEVPIPVGGTYLDGFVSAAGVASINAGVGSTADDVFCVVAFAPPGYKKLHIEWHYQLDGGAELIKALPVIPIVTVTLVKVGNGLVGAPAEVCTSGWDGGFLTGATENDGDDPDKVNQVTIADFVIFGGTTNGPELVKYVRQVGPEWCAGIASTTNEDDLNVRFDFDAVYNRVTTTTKDNDGDDQRVPVSPILPPDRLVDIRDLVELRHVTIDGQVPPRQSSGPLVIHSPHVICLIGANDPTDALAAGGISIQPIAPPDAPTASSIDIFRSPNPTLDDQFQGVEQDTICFRYTSAAPGEHTVSVNFTNNGFPDTAFFDSDGDGNGVTAAEGQPAGPLVTEWNRIDSTSLTSTTKGPSDDVVTFTRLSVPLDFNVADGTFIGSANVVEWVLGSHKTGGQVKAKRLLDGALLRVSIEGPCGYFVVPDSANPTFAKPTVVTGISVGGRFELNDFDSNPFSEFMGDEDAKPDDLQFSTLNTGGCGAGQGSVVRIVVEVYYPNQLNTPAAPQEWVDIDFTFSPSLKTPRVAWAGEYVTITYAVSGDCDGATVQFIRPKGQPGSFIPDGGVTLKGPGHATRSFDDNCSAAVRYESEDPGEVDIEMFIENNNFSKISTPIFFLALEDVTIESTPDQFVSTFGDVTARVRGYFPGSNPSGRPEEKKADGRTVPKDRWILPTDWELLKGQPEFRRNWGSPDMPSAIITFFMENEGVMNNYKASVKSGAAGFFIPDDPTDFSFNVNPHTKATTALGTVTRPRMMSQPSENDGSASVDTFGDRNLSYEGCAPNLINKNPHCKPEDITGRTRYFVVAEYPQAGNRGKFPAIASNVTETVWRWAGYKDVTVVNTDSPQIKYVVAHLRDRDGFCDAANYNNTLGVPVKFEIDAGGGTIIGAADAPFTINGTRRFATTTTFDTTDALGRPINVGISRPTLFPDQLDECQAWIKVTNSLMQPTNVMVTFPAPPSPVPGDIRITNLQCVGSETITVKNFGPNIVNLGGFALKSAGADVGNAEELDLIGILGPGESKTFSGGPGAADSVGWIGTGSEVFDGASDFASLVWEDFALSTVFCDGTSLLQPIPAAFPLDGEGEIIIDIVIPFGNEVAIPLTAGWNLVPTGQATVSIASAFAGNQEKVTAIYAWDATLEKWTHYIFGAPAGVNTIDVIGKGVVLWVLVKQPFTLTLPR